MTSATTPLEITVARHGERLDDLEERFTKHEDKQNHSLEVIGNELKSINTSLNGRPTWLVSLVITTLLGVVVALGEYIVLRG